MNKQKNKKIIGIIFGGKSVEHDISIITGVQTLNAINKLKYNIVPIYISKNGDWYTSNSFFDITTFQKDDGYKKYAIKIQLGDGGKVYIDKNKKLKLINKIDFALLATHGSYGENGSLQGFLNMHNIAYSSPDVLSSAMCMSKLTTKLLLQSKNISQVNFTYITQNEYKKGYKTYKEKFTNFQMPLIVKPSNLGSSIGITYCKNLKQLKNAISFAFLFDTIVIIEEAVSNLKEVNISVLGNSQHCELSDIEEVFVKDNFLSFENKYMNKESSAKGMENSLRNIPAKISKEMENTIKMYAEKAYTELNCKGLIRIDFLINNEEGKVYLNELNTIPGSLSNYLWKTKKYSFSKLLDKLIAYSEEDKILNDKKIINFSTNVLKQFDNKGKLFVNK